MFIPPRCPNRDCKNHLEPDVRRFIGWGSYTVRCRESEEPRFRCVDCGRTFSRQTFRHDYRDKRPDCNEQLFDLLNSGVGLRQAARVLRVGATTAQQKMRKMSKVCAHLHDNLCSALPPDRAYLLDEEESYEAASIRPLTVPIVIERKSWFVVATDVGSIRRLAPAGTARRRRQDLEERKRGRRPDRSRRVVAGVLRRLRELVSGDLELLTDEKSSYATLARQLFGDRVAHSTTAGSAARTSFNPLFPINVTIAMSRDNCGRLRRRSWLVSKSARWLRGHLSIFTVFRNYVRRRFNRDQVHQTPALFLGLLPRNLWPEEVVRWRQDWGAISPHPMSSDGGRSIVDAAGAAAA